MRRDAPKTYRHAEELDVELASNPHIFSTSDRSCLVMLVVISCWYSENMHALCIGSSNTNGRCIQVYLLHVMKIRKSCRLRQRGRTSREYYCNYFAGCTKDLWLSGFSTTFTYALINVHIKYMSIIYVHKCISTCDGDFTRLLWELWITKIEWNVRLIKWAYKMHQHNICTYSQLSIYNGECNGCNCNLFEIKRNMYFCSAMQIVSAILCVTVKALLWGVYQTKLRFTIDHHNPMDTRVSITAYGHHYF